VLAAVKEQSDAAEKLIASWADTKPWINENDTKAASDKVSNVRECRLSGALLEQQHSAAAAAAAEDVEGC
jgi:hypothetical protein